MIHFQSTWSKMKVVVILFVAFNAAHCFVNPYRTIREEPVTDDPGPALYLTPLIEQGKIKQARNAAQVNFAGFKNVSSYSGYLTVDKQFDSNMFFWFFPSFSNFETDPVVLWLQGGPGASSLIGLFAENGPFKPAKHGVNLRKYNWVHGHSVIYIDNPVGAGYSFTNGGYVKNETVVGQNLYKALLQFFQLFPELQKNDFFVTGESYADYLIERMGKYIQSTEVRRAIHVGNNTFNGESSIVEINLALDIMQSVAPWITQLLSHYRVLIYNV
ncbi:Serine carboxypeptidase [Popillia japonica]|uniref:Serine carboxypeptidase n=1 Tax=Popillia japonica TaxID=7064 RepID=A0AAW1MHM2_POPJA